MEYNRISLSMQDDYLALLDLTGSVTADHCFPVLFGWDQVLEYRLMFHDGLCWIRQERPRPVYLAPVGDWQGRDWERELALHLPLGAEVLSVPEELALEWGRQLGGRILLEEDRDAFEYLHLTEDLAHLKGNRYMRKRNHVNRFARQFSYRYGEMTPDDLERIVDLQRRWCAARDCSGSFVLEGENRAIMRVLDNYQALRGLVGGYVEVGGSVVAYAIGEGRGDTLFVHFEKGDPAYGSVYQVINREFALHNLGFKFLNREEDMGDPGLRDAKMSYLPMDFVRKHRAVLRPGS